MVTTGVQLQSGMIRYPSQDGTQIDAYLSQPSTPGRYPGVIVTMEGMGLEDHMKDLARRFAEEGYIAISPDLYTREGRPAPDNVLETLFSVPDSQTMGDLEGAALYLKSRPHANGKVGIIGFCSGGRYTLMFACTSKNVNAAVDSAGGISSPTSSPRRVRWRLSTWYLTCPARCLPCLARRMPILRRPMPRVSRRNWIGTARPTNSRCIKTPGTPSSPITGPAIAPLRRRICGIGCWCSMRSTSKIKTARDSKLC